MSQVRRKIAPPLVGSDIILVIRPGQNINQVLDCTYDQLVQSLQQYFSGADGFVPETRTLTINGVTYDLSQDRSWTVSGGGAVDSVNGQTGVVVLALGDLSDVSSTTPTTNQILQWNGTEWVPATVTGTGTVTSVGVTAGTGISASVTNPTTAPNITITNTAPDLTVSLGTTGTGLSVTGTYPNFTLQNTLPDQTVSLAAGTGISVSGTYPSFTISNTATTGGGLKSGTASGTNNYTVTITGVTSYVDGDAYVIKFTNSNDDDSTININSLGVKNLEKQANIRVTGGDIAAGQELIIVYDGTNFQCLGIAPNQFFAYVTNDDTVAITKGMPVYAAGATGNRMTVKRAYNTTDTTSAQTVGLVFSSSIGVNQKGFIITQGVLSGVNTSAYVAGEQLYLGDTAGTYWPPASVSPKPSAPNHLVYLGIVERSNAGNGQIYVKPQNGYELDEIHDVALKAPYQVPVNNDVLTYITGSPKNMWQARSVSSLLPTSVKTGSFGVTVDGVTGVVQVGATGYVVMPYAGTITGWSITSNVVGTISFDITSASGAIPTVSIIGAGGNYPTLTSNQFITSTTMISWTLGFAAGDVFGFSVRSSPAPSLIKNATLTIRTTKT